MANKGKRMVNEDLIKQIGQGGGGSDINLQAGAGISITTGETAEDKIIAVDNTVALKSELPAEVSGTNDGTNWTNLTIGSDTYGIPSGGGTTVAANVTIPSGATVDDLNNLQVGTSIYIAKQPVYYAAGDGLNMVNQTFSIDPTQVAVTKVAPYPVTTGPSSNDAVTIDAWVKSLPIITSRSGTSALSLAGFTNIIEIAVGESVEVQGYFAFVTELPSNPYTIQHINVCTAENRTGTNTLIDRSCTNKITITRTANNDFGVYNVLYRGENTSLSAMVDPIDNQNYPVYSFSLNAGTSATISSRNDRNFVRQASYSVTETNPTGGNMPLAPILTCPSDTDGTYVLKATVASGVVTYSWVAEV